MSSIDPSNLSPEQIQAMINALSAEQQNVADVSKAASKEVDVQAQIAANEGQAANASLQTYTAAEGISNEAELAASTAQLAVQEGIVDATGQMHEMEDVYIKKGNEKNTDGNNVDLTNKKSEGQGPAVAKRDKVTGKIFAIEGRALANIMKENPNVAVRVDGIRAQYFGRNISEKTANLLSQASIVGPIARKILDDMQREDKKRAERKDKEQAALQQNHDLQVRNADRRAEQLRNEAQLLKITEFFKLVLEISRDKAREASRHTLLENNHELWREKEKVQEIVQNSKNRKFDIITDQVKANQQLANQQAANRQVEAARSQAAEQDQHTAPARIQHVTTTAVKASTGRTTTGRIIEIGKRGFSGMKIDQSQTVEQGGTSQISSESNGERAIRAKLIGHNASAIAPPLQAAAAANY